MKRPLFLALACYLAVLFLGATRGAVAAAAVAAVAALLFAIPPGRRRRHRLLCAALLLTAAVSCLLVHHTALMPARKLDGVRAEVVGRVTQVFVNSAGTAGAIVRVQSVAARTGPVRVRTNLQLFAPESPLQQGDEVRLTATLRYLPDLAQEAWVERYNLSGNLLLRADRVEQLTVTAGRLPLFSRAMQAIAGFRDSQSAKVQNALARALLFGDSNGLTERQHRLFVSTGTVHMLTFSGTHFAAIAFVLTALLGQLGLLRRQVAAAMIAMVAAVTALMGFAPSVARAGLMLLVFHAGTLLHREADSPTSLALAGFLLCFWRPAFIQSTSFLLSFSATAGVVLLASPLTDMLAGAIPPWRERRLWRSVCGLAAVSVAASLLLFPVTMWIYGEMTTLSVVGNMLTYLPMMGVMLLGALTLFGLPLGGLTEALADLCMLLLDRVSSLPGGMLQADSAVVWVCFAAVVLLIAVWRLHNGLESCGPAPAACGVAVVVATALLTAPTAPPDLLEITMIDVGQGLSVLVRDGDSAYLIDCGSEGTAAEDRIAHTLRRQGVNRLNAVILTHTHADHVSGFGSLPDQVAVDRLILREEADPSMLYYGAVLAAERAGFDILYLRDRLTLQAGQSRLTLYPHHANLREPGGDALNNDSLLVLVERGSSSLLLTGDAERETEAHYAAYAPFAEIDVLQVAHHGSNTSSGAPFLLHARPAVALISVGANNRYGHPDDAVLARLGEVAGRTLRTDRHGSITLSTSGDGIFTIHTQREDRDE